MLNKTQLGDRQDTFGSCRAYEKEEIPEEGYSFHPCDEEQWLSHLTIHGYCVIQSAACDTEVQSAKTLIWKDICQLYEVDRDDISTWGRIPTGSAGIVNRKLPQSEGPWLIRGLDSIRRVFSSIWNTDELITSMDSLLLWLPWWLNDSWLPYSEGLHIDQNPFEKPDRCCIQGMVPLIDVSDESGGLEVVPFSHLPDAVAIFKENHPHLRSRGDWCVLKSGDRLGSNAKLLYAKAGDLILWDSRLIHGGRVGVGRAGTTRMEGVAENVDLARLAVTVCMTPRELASEVVLKKRQRGFQQGYTFTHWPHEAVVTFLGSSEHIPVELPARVKELI